MESKKRYILRFFLLFVVASPPANAQTSEARFDVNCDGISVIASFKDIAKPESRSTQTKTYRIDLDSKRWCVGQCDETFAIYHVDRKFITLQYQKDEISETVISINRENGSVLDRLKFFSTVHPKEDIIWMFSGKCERGNFSGFPSLRF